MNTRNLLTLMAFGGVVALVACSSSDDADKFGSTDQYCAARADAECTNLAKKCGASVDACTAKRKSLCTTAAGAAIAQGRSYKSAAVQDCLDKINDVYKDQAANTSPQDEADVTKICNRVFTGNKQEREPCTKDSFECDGALICDGVCATEETVHLNDGCGNAGQVCETGTYCAPQGGKSFCAAKKKMDEICGPDSPCVETLRCVNHCVAKVTVGQPCDTDAECADEAPYCDQTTTPKKCRPKYESTSGACKDFGSGG